MEGPPDAHERLVPDDGVSYDKIARTPVENELSLAEAERIVTDPKASDFQRRTAQQVIGDVTRVEATEQPPELDN